MNNKTTNKKDKDRDSIYRSDFLENRATTDRKTDFLTPHIY